MPYMAAHLPRRYRLQTLLEKNDWACEILGVRTTEVEGSSLTRLQNTTTVFWKDPALFVENWRLLHAKGIY